MTVLQKTDKQHYHRNAHVLPGICCNFIIYMLKTIKTLGKYDKNFQVTKVFDSHIFLKLSRTMRRSKTETLICRGIYTSVCMYTISCINQNTKVDGASRSHLFSNTRVFLFHRGHDRPCQTAGERGRCGTTASGSSHPSSWPGPLDATADATAAVEGK